MIKLVLAAMLLATPALARPPPAGSPDAVIMQDYGDWIMQQRTAYGGLCCSLSDGRPLSGDEIRINGNQYELLYSRKHWDDGTDKWIPVPPDAVRNFLNPTGYVIAWVRHGHIYCLSLTGAV